MGKSGKTVGLAVAVISAAIVAGLLKFNFSTIDYNQYIVGNLIGLFWIPACFILLIFREPMEKFGFSPSNSKRIWPVVGVLFVVLFAGLFVVSHWRVFQDYYPLFRRYPQFDGAFAGYPNTNPFLSAPMVMLYAELSYGMYLFCWEFFFRGFMLFGLQRNIGWFAVILQALAFGLLHFGKPMTEMAASFGAGVILGIIALNARSFIPCFILHWAASISFDLLVVAGRHH